jgi:DNA-binding SARP family transcriptional activator
LRYQSTPGTSTRHFREDAIQTEIDLAGNHEASDQVKFHILGPLKVATSDGIVIAGGKRLRTLLGILLLQPSTVVPMERIIEGVWSEEPPRSAVENIRTYVWQLRSLMHDGDGRERLESHPAGYRLNVEPEELDLVRFCALAAEGDRALRRGSMAGAAILLEQALDLWRGDVLAELELGPTAQAKADALNEQRRQVELDWIGARLSLGEHADMVPVLRELTAERPLDEDLWRHFIVALYATGRTGEALSAYTRARSVLIAELGIEPGARLREAHAVILEGRDLLNLAPTASTTRSWGGQAVPRQLPAADPDFTGRFEATREVHRLVEEMRTHGGDRRAVVVVSGPPGAGKSALAIAAAASVLHEFPDGQLYADLGGSAEWPPGPGDALVTALDGFGLRAEAIPERADRQRTLYRSLLAERKMLILLDNATSASQVAPLVPGQGQNLLIVTSSNYLADLDADLRINLGPLASDAAVHMLGAISGHERVRCEPIAARKIVDACDRLPLAIRIAAARLAARPEYPLSKLQKRIARDDRVLDELALGALVMRDRLDAAYDALDSSTRRSFRMLGRLGGNSITAADLARLLKLTYHAADRELEQLVHECLLIPGPVLDSVTRYRMPRLLHLYARERLVREATDRLAIGRDS